MSESNVDSSEFKANIAKFLGNIAVMKENYLKKLALGVVKMAKDDTPVDTGDLKRSIRGEMISDSEVLIIAGDGSVDYAIKVHEDMGANHPNGGKAKYIEDNINALASDGPQNMANILAKNILKDIKNQ